MALQIPGTKPVSSELAFPSSEPGRSHILESVPTLPGSVEAGVSFDLPAQADTLHSANKVINCLLFVFLLARPTQLLPSRLVRTANSALFPPEGCVSSSSLRPLFSFLIVLLIFHCLLLF